MASRSLNFMVSVMLLIFGCVLLYLAKDSVATKDSLIKAMARVEVLESALKTASNQNAMHAAMLSDRSEILEWSTTQLTVGERWTFGDFRSWTVKHGYPEPEKPDREYNPPTAWRRDYESVIKKKQ